MTGGQATWGIRLKTPAHRGGPGKSRPLSALAQADTNFGNYNLNIPDRYDFHTWIWTTTICSRADEITVHDNRVVVGGPSWNPFKPAVLPPVRAFATMSPNKR